MKTRIRAVVVLMVVGILLIGASPAVAVPPPPPLPSSFWGTLGGEGLDVGDPVTAEIDGVEYAYSQVQLVGGETVYALNVPGDNPSTAAIEGGTSGDTIVFKVNGTPAKETAVWQSGTNVKHDLTLTKPPDGFRIYLPFVSK